MSSIWSSFQRKTTKPINTNNKKNSNSVEIVRSPNDDTTFLGSPSSRLSTMSISSSPKKYAIDFDYEEKMIEIFLQRREDMINALRDPRRGIEIKDRKSNLKVYKNCFIASEVVTWLLKNFSTVIFSRGVAVRLGEALQKEGVFGHVTRSYLFKDENLFFQFVASDVVNLDRCLQMNPNLIQEIKSSEIGFPLGEKRKGLRTYKNCFTGRDAVNWLLERSLVDDRERAVRFGNAMLMRRIFDHVTQKHYFEDSPLMFYTFLRDDDNVINNGTPSPRERKETVTPTVNSSSDASISRFFLKKLPFGVTSSETTKNSISKDLLVDLLQSETLLFSIFDCFTVQSLVRVSMVSKRYKDLTVKYGISLATYYFNRRAFDITPTLSVKNHTVMWFGIINNFEKFYDRNKKQLKEWIYKYVPNSLRGKIWQELSGSSDLMSKNSGLFEFLITKECSVDFEVKRDSAKTFSDMSPASQDKLYRVLKAFANFNHQIQYCQGMNYIAAVLTRTMGEEESFWCMVSLMKYYHLDVIYEPGLKGLMTLLSIFDNLIEFHVPNVHAVFKKLNIGAHQFANKWFLTLFCCVFPIEVVYKIWDMYICDSWVAVGKIGVAIIKLSEENLVKISSFEEILVYFDNLPSHLKDANLLLKTALSIDIKKTTFYVMYETTKQ